MEDFYNRIDELLKKQKKSKDDLAKLIGLSSVQVFYNWKSLKKIPDVNTAVKIAEYLNTSVEYLITGNENNDYKKGYDTLLNDLQDFIDEKKSGENNV